MYSRICAFAHIFWASFSVAPTHHHMSFVIIRSPWLMLHQSRTPMTPYPLSRLAVLHQRITHWCVLHHLRICVFPWSISQFSATSPTARAYLNCAHQVTMANATLGHDRLDTVATLKTASSPPNNHIEVCNPSFLYLLQISVSVAPPHHHSSIVPIRQLRPTIHQRRTDLTP